MLWLYLLLWGEAAHENDRRLANGIGGSHGMATGVTQIPETGTK